MNAHKKNKNKFMLFLNVETSKKEATNILDNREKKISDGYNQITKDLEEQNKKFQERKKGKKKMNMEKKGLEGKNEILDKGNEDKKTNAEEKEDDNFSYLEKTSYDPIVFEYKPRDENDLNPEQNIFKADSINVKLAICILLKEDSQEQSSLLKETLDGIFANFDSLDNYKIKPENIYIYIFANKINNNILISGDVIKEKLKDKNKNNYLLTYFKKKGDERDYVIGVICKNNYMSNMESLKCFYCNIISNLKPDDKILFTSIITAGVSPNKEALSNLIQACLIPKDENNSTKERDCVSVPALEIDPQMEEQNLFGKIIKYERTHFGCSESCRIS